MSWFLKSSLTVETSPWTWSNSISPVVLQDLGAWHPNKIQNVLIIIQKTWIDFATQELPLKAAFITVACAAFSAILFLSFQFSVYILQCSSVWTVNFFSNYLLELVTCSLKVSMKAFIRYKPKLSNHLK